MTMDFGDGQNALADAESAAQATACQLASLYGISTSAGLRADGPDPDRRHRTTTTSLLHVQRPDAGELRRVQRRRRAVLLGGRRLRQGHRLRSTRRSSTRSPAAAAAAAPAPARPGRSPATRACASTTARPAPPTSTRSRSTPATAPTPSSGPSASGNTLQALGKCLDVDAAGTANGTTVDLYDCNGTGAQAWAHAVQRRAGEPELRQVPRRHRLPPLPAPRSRSGPAPAPPTSPGPCPV